MPRPKRKGRARLSLRDVYLESWAGDDEHPESPTFEEWLSQGCPSMLDYSPAEQRVVDLYLVNVKPMKGANR